MVPEGSISETNFRRGFLAQFTGPQAADLVFRHEYERFCRDWSARHGWPLFLPPSPGDAHLLDTVRLPVTDSQAELDEQIGHLAKLLVDALNEAELAKRVERVPDGAKGIAKLEAFLEAIRFSQRESVIQYLRDLQTLRSTGTAHRKGSAYEKILVKLGMEATRKPEAMRRLLEEGTATLRSLSCELCEPDAG